MTSSPDNFPAHGWRWIRGRSRLDAAGGGRPALSLRPEVVWLLPLTALNQWLSCFVPGRNFVTGQKTALNDILLLGNINFRGRRQTATSAFGGHAVPWVYDWPSFSIQSIQSWCSRLYTARPTAPEPPSTYCSQIRRSADPDSLMISIFWGASGSAATAIWDEGGLYLWHFLPF